MRIIRYRCGDDLKLGLVQGEIVADIKKESGESYSCFIDLLREAYERRVDLKDFIMERVEDDKSGSKVLPYKDLEESSVEGVKLLSPLDPPEVWGCGVTYRRSRAAREFETSTKGVYDLVYEAERPEVFFKATASRCVGPNDEIYVRGDSKWSVPEAELAFVVGMEEEVVGFTVGNDVTARDIEGENPLYLPQAKIYDGCCAIGPSIVTVDEVGVNPKLEVECRIYRGGELVFKGSTNTSQMKRSIEDLKAYLCLYNSIPAGTVCLTGTGIVPPDDFYLKGGDVVEITIEKIGTLRNRVRQL